MKKVVAPATKETAVYYSDFSGKCFDEFGPTVEMSFEFNYGSNYDSSKIQLHLTNEEAEQVLDFIKTKLSKDWSDNFKKTLPGLSNALSYSQIVSCEKLLRRLTD